MNRFCFIIVLVMGLASRSWAAASSGNDGQASPGASALVALEDLRSFAWWPLPPLQGAMRHENFREDIQSAIEDDLEDKDIDEAFLSLNPDFYIAYYAQVRGKIPGAFLVRWPASHKVGMQYPGDYWGPVYRPLAQPTPAAVLPGPAALSPSWSSISSEPPIGGSSGEGRRFCFCTPSITKKNRSDRS